jgi:transcriptional antiterminator RfaH
MSDYWYCIRTKRYKENWVAQQLLELSQEAYLPLLREQRHVRRKLKWVVEPLFPCYLFARFFIDKNFGAVSRIAGVVSVVGTPEDGPLVVDEQIINSLRERSSSGYIEVKPALFFPGEKLQVIAGPFQGLEALFQKELKAGERVAVLLEILSSRVRIDMPRAYVQKNSAIHY